MVVSEGDILFAYVYLDPANPPQSIALQFKVLNSDLEPADRDPLDSSDWRHRAYWGPSNPLFTQFGIACDGGATTKFGTIQTCNPPVNQKFCTTFAVDNDCNFTKNPNSPSGDGCARSLNLGPRPDAGKWVRLEVPAYRLGLTGLKRPAKISGVALTMQGGRAVWDRIGKQTTETVWVDDALPAGATPVNEPDVWSWQTSNISTTSIGTNPPISTPPKSGLSYHVSEYNGGVHQHYFVSASDPLKVNVGDNLFAWIFIDPGQPAPETIMLQWNDGSWDHRAYWGDGSKIGFGTDGTNSKRNMGNVIPQIGKWVRLEVPASMVGLDGSTVSGMAFTMYGGKAYWDRAGKTADLAQMAATPAFYQLFNNTAFTTYLLTTFSSGASYNNWLDGFSDGERDAERNEIKRLGDYLITSGRFSNDSAKKFIILNWEGEHVFWDGQWRAELSGLADFQYLRDALASDYAYNGLQCSTDTWANRWDDNKKWLQARVNGVADSRNANPGQASRLFSGVEIFLAETFYVWNSGPALYNNLDGSPQGTISLVGGPDTRPHVPCGTKSEDANRPDKYSCLSSRTLPKLGETFPDAKPYYYSYSSYETVQNKVVNSTYDLKTNFRLLLKDNNESSACDSITNQADKDKCILARKSVLKKIQTVNPQANEWSFIIGEWNFGAAAYGDLPNGPANAQIYFTDFLNSFGLTDGNALHPSYFTFWQTFSRDSSFNNNVEDGLYEVTNQQLVVTPLRCRFYEFLTGTTCPFSPFAPDFSSGDQMRKSLYGLPEAETKMILRDPMAGITSPRRP